MRFRRAGRFAGGLDPTVTDRSFTVPPEPKPKLIVWFGRSTGDWHWMTGDASGPLIRLHDFGQASTWGAALAVGLDALDSILGQRP